MSVHRQTLSKYQRESCVGRRACGGEWNFMRVVALAFFMIIHISWAMCTPLSTHARERSARNDANLLIVDAIVTKKLIIVRSRSLLGLNFFISSKSSLDSHRRWNLRPWEAIRSQTHTHHQPDIIQLDGKWWIVKPYQVRDFDLNLDSRRWLWNPPNYHQSLVTCAIKTITNEIWRRITLGARLRRSCFQSQPQVASFKSLNSPSRLLSSDFPAFSSSFGNGLKSTLSISINLWFWFTTLGEQLRLPSLRF